MLRVWDSGFRVLGSRFRIWDSGFRVLGLGFRVWLGFGFRVGIQGCRYRVSGKGVRSRV